MFVVFAAVVSAAAGPAAHIEEQLRRGDAPHVRDAPHIRRGSVARLISAADINARLQEIAADRAKHYSCKISIGAQTGTEAFAGASDSSTDCAPAGLVAQNGLPPARSHLDFESLSSFAAKYVWGSVTKLLTGSAILRMQEKGLLDIDKPVAPTLDKALAAIGLGPFATLFGDTATEITARQLGSMQSGVPDYDTAKPYPRPPMDPFRQQVYDDPSKEWDPVDILNVSWVSTGKLDFPPGSRTSYSSTNFVLLGLLLSELAGSPTWDTYDQLSGLDALPPARRALYKADVSLAVHGAPKDWTAVHGFDRTSYNGQNASAKPGHDVFDVKGVYGGWTASDVTATAAGTARLGYDIFGNAGPRILQPSSVRTMIPHNTRHEFPYGFATFNLTQSWGVSSGSKKNYNEAYGHLGATYGYQSVVAYFPAADVSISIASNLETDDQVQPSDTACHAYNAVLAYLRNETEPNCEFVTAGYYGGYCDCGNNYKCSRLFKQCVKSSSGTLSKSDCEAIC